jgi:uncharacterized protein YdeI (YjbR/CyaY-like superfamily)
VATVVNQPSQHYSEAWVRLVNGPFRTPENTFTYTDAVEEALCFGWIDAVEEALCFGWIAVVKKIDDQSRVQRFVPRRPKSNWSELNRQRVRLLEARGLMLPAGRAAIPDYVKADIHSASAAQAAAPTLAPDLEKALKTAKALDRFREFPVDYQRQRAYFITSLVDDTRKARIRLYASLAYGFNRGGAKVATSHNTMINQGKFDPAKLWPDEDFRKQQCSRTWSCSS